MPIYEYACACGTTFEELITRRSDEADVRCPRCKSSAVERVMSRPAATRAGGQGAPTGPGPCGPVG
jgi:putative FmdB family regulatory protein